MKEPRLRIAKCLTQSHGVTKWECEDLSPGLSDSSSGLFYHHTALLIVKIHTSVNFCLEI